MKHIAALSLMLLLIACGEKKPPAEIYQEYNNRVISGLPFDEEIAYFSKRKALEIEEAIAKAMQQSNKTRPEIIAVFNSMAQKIEKCMSISLLEEMIDGNQATVTFSQKDTCNQDPDLKVAGKRIISMVDEDGWKIDEIDMAF